MSTSLAGRGVRVVLLDIEGTTTPIAFVHDTLFTYARAHLAAFLEAQWATGGVRDAVERLAAEHRREREAAPAWRDESPAATRASTVEYARWLMDRDRKSPGLKLLQGLIWEEGYQVAALRGVVFDDVPVAMARWRDEGLVIAIYSSGSELAQRRLFASTTHGDLTALVTAFFDTAVGPKIESASYARIAQALGHQPREIAFISDVTAELAAARAAGCQVVLAARPGNPPQANAEQYDAVGSFEGL